MIKIYESCKDSKNRITKIDSVEKIKKTDLELDLNPEITFQNFYGFGGAITESTGFVLSKLSPEKRTEILKAYFTKNGNNYTFVRTHMNSCDFSLENWSCTPEENLELSNFSMERTNKYITPFLKQANEFSQNKLKLLISPWSPPAWMKANKDMNHGGKLLPQFKSLWAKHFCLFIKALQKENLNINYVTVQNEPAAKQTWDSCLWTALEEGDFAVNYLYPEFQKNNLSNVKILVWDHNRDLLKERFENSMSVLGAEKAIAGAAFHWYADDHFDQLKYLSEKYRHKDFIFSEGCIEGGPQNGKWHTGERYGHNIINDLNNGCNGWIDWNITLNTEGGPNHVGNFCDSPILADTEKNEYYLQSSYFYIGHFSRFIKPNSKRIKIEKLSDKTDKNAEFTAFKNSDNSVALVIMNKSEKNITYGFKIKNEQKIANLPPHSIQTVFCD